MVADRVQLCGAGHAESGRGFGAGANGTDSGDDSSADSDNVTVTPAGTRAGVAFPENPNTLGEAGYVMASTGETAQAKELLARLKMLAREGSSINVARAKIEIGLGQEDQAADTLQDYVVGFAQLGIGLGSLSQWHAFDALPDNVRYRELVARTLKLPTARP